VTVALTLTNYRGLVWSGFDTAQVGSTVVLKATFGPWAGVYAGYVYLLGLVGIYALLLMAVRSLDLYRGQSVALVVGGFAPFISSIVNMTGVTPISLTTPSFAVSGVAFWFAVFRYRFLDVAPMARDTVVGSLPDPYLVADERGRVVDLNPAAESLFGSAVGRGIDEFVPGPVSGDGGEDNLQEDGDRQGNRDEVELGGRTFDVRSSSVERGDRTVGEAVLLRDITELKEREEELQLANERLERFASVVSHDLRNPLTVARGQLNLAMEGEGDLEMIADAHERIERIIEDVLAMARKDRIETRRVGVGETARRAWESVETRDAELTVAVEDGRLEADHDRLLRVFENLFRNSIEHGGGRRERRGR
jgi:PAS domain S-box